GENRDVVDQVGVDREEFRVPLVVDSWLMWVIADDIAAVEDELGVQIGQTVRDADLVRVARAAVADHREGEHGLIGGRRRREPAAATLYSAAQDPIGVGNARG